MTKTIVDFMKEFGEIKEDSKAEFKRTSWIVFDNQSRCWRESNIGIQMGVFDPKKGWTPIFR